MANPSYDNDVVWMSSAMDNTGEVAKIASYIIYDATGQVVQEVNNVNERRVMLDVTGLAQGSYWIQVLTENNDKIEAKIIKL